MEMPGVKTIVIVDDDPDFVKLVRTYLTKEGYKVKGCTNEKELFEYLKKENPDLIILDILLPGLSGIEICKLLKEKYPAMPIIMLSGKSGEADKVSALNTGADDYVVKPCSLSELNARIRAVLRRGLSESKAEKIAVSSALEIDLDRFEVTAAGQKVELTPAEFRILEFLASRKGQVFTRERILEHLWGEEKIVVERTIDVHIRHLREKLGKTGDIIKNVRGFGYKFDEEM